MTFLLQKFNAINRTRTEVRARNGLRSSASGIAFTGRLAACLLLAGFLGVGSAMAQPKVLRVDGGHVRIKHTDAAGGAITLQVHHFQIGTADAVNNPTGLSTTNDGTGRSSFLVGNMALVTVYGQDSVDVAPVTGTGAFKIAFSPDGDADLTDADDNPNNNPGTPVMFEVVSNQAPYITASALGAGYNMGADSDVESLMLTPRDKTSEEYDLTELFSDPNDVFLTYDTKVDMVAEDAPDTDALNALTAGNPLRAKVTKDGVAIVSAGIDGNKLTVALTDKAMGCQTNASNVTFCDQTDIWVFGRDGSEYARKRIQVNVGSSSLPHVSETPLQDMILREGAAADTEIALHTGFADPALGPDAGVGDNNGVPRMLTYEVTIDDKNAPKVGSDTEFTYVTPSMTAKVNLATAGEANLSIRPRVAGAVKFTVTATDKGVQCRTDYVLARKGDHDNDPATPDAYGANGTGAIVIDADNPATKCLEDGSDPQVTTDLFPDSKSVKDEFTVTVVTKTTPLTDNAIPALSGKNALDADGDAKTVDLADVDTEADNAQAAFEDPTEQGLTYMAYTSKADSAFVVATVDGSVVTLTPMWRIGRDAKTATVKVKATNVDDESTTTSFSVTVNKATKPVVNLLVAPLLGVGYTLNTGDEPRVVNLRNLTGADDPKMAVPLFIDPDAADKDPLPGGLLHKIQVSDVVADHVYENQSEENDITTSAMRIQLDPATAMLTITPTGANSASVTIWGIDRDRNMISATVMITVVSGVGTEGEELPTEVELSQNYPNPFNPQTTIDYALPQAGDVSLVVYDMLGREVDVLLDGPQAAGRHTVRFGANHLPNGTYVYRLVAGDKTITRTMVLVK